MRDSKRVCETFLARADALDAHEQSRLVDIVSTVCEALQRHQAR